MEKIWGYVDRQLEELLKFMDAEQESLSDEVQQVFDHFRDLAADGRLNKQQIKRLHRDMERWKKEGYAVGEMKLLLKEYTNRSRILVNTALFLCLYALLLKNYQKTMERDKIILKRTMQFAYNEKFNQAYIITGKGSKRLPDETFLEQVLHRTMPDGGNYYDSLYADARYGASQLAKKALAGMQQGKVLDIYDKDLQRVLSQRREWQLRRVKRTPDGGVAGYYDMVESFAINTAVAQAYEDARVSRYRFVAVLDERTTDACESLHGKEFPLSEMKIGINFPPVYPPPHPCRSGTDPVQ